MTKKIYLLKSIMIMINKFGLKMKMNRSDHFVPLKKGSKEQLPKQADVYLHLIDMGYF